MSAFKSFAVLGCGLLLAACGGGDVGSAADSAAAKAQLASLPAPYNTADLDNGKLQFSKCRACHTVAEGGADMVGPNLYGVFGKPAASRPDYKYSDALKNAGFVWDAKHLNDWIAAPQTYLPGTKMSFPGVNAEKDRIDLIAYLKVETGYGKAP